MPLALCISTPAIAFIAGILCAKQDEVDFVAKKAAAARELHRVTGASKMGAQVTDQMGQALSLQMGSEFDGFWAEFRKSLNTDEIVDMVAPIYTKHFSLEELEGLVAFNTSPLGLRLNAENPGIMQESMAAGMDWGQKLGAEAMTRFLERDQK